MKLVLVKLVLVVENPGVLRVQAEHQPDAQRVEAFQRLGAVRVLVLFQQRVIEDPDNLPGFQGDFHFPLDIHVPGMGQEMQAVELLFQVGEQEDLRRVVGAVHVVDAELPEVADHNPAGELLKGHVSGVPPRLLKGRQHGPVRLFLSLVQVNVRALLLNQDAGGGNVGVNKAGMAEFHRQFKLDELRGILHAVDFLQQFHPEGLRLLLFVPASPPVFQKRLCACALFQVCHVVPSCECVYSICAGAPSRRSRRSWRSGSMGRRMPARISAAPAAVAGVPPASCFHRSSRLALLYRLQRQDATVFWESRGGRHEKRDFPLFRMFQKISGKK